VTWENPGEIHKPGDNLIFVDRWFSFRSGLLIMGFSGGEIIRQAAAAMQCNTRNQRSMVISCQWCSTLCICPQRLGFFWWSSMGHSPKKVKRSRNGVETMLVVLEGFGMGFFLLVFFLLQVLFLFNKAQKSEIVG